VRRSVDVTQQTLKEFNLPLFYEDIIKILPHRYPFLFVDRIVELEIGKKVVGIKTSGESVTLIEPILYGFLVALAPIMF
jgi:3-hydroxymyristoyl/3-hydroxydecanoyl-(acyl carrier protein) dehydratase